jgi:hypothetical protein
MTLRLDHGGVGEELTLMGGLDCRGERPALTSVSTPHDEHGHPVELTRRQ